MFRKMKKISISLIILSFFLVAAFTTYKVVTKHQKNLLLVSEKRIVEAAKKCQWEEKCPQDKVLLKELYANNYLEQEINPLTKEIYNDNSYVLKKEDTYQFIVVD